MDKRNFVYNYVPLKSDFDNLQNGVESGIKDVASAVAGKGILSGLVASIAGSDATVSAGVAYDGQGNRIAPTAALVVSIGGITRPSQGRYKWVTLVLRYETKDEGEIIDGNNKKWPARLLDSHSSLLLEGAEGTASAITKPALLDWQVPLLDIRVDHSSPWENLVTSTERRPSLIPVADASSRLQRHEDKTGGDAHGATSAATAGQIVVRDAQGRAQVAAPAAAADIARKDTVDGHAGLNATAAVAVHGIRQGAGNGFDSDMLDGKHLDDVLRLAWPIGSVYIQFPGERSPQGLLPGTWTKMVFSKGYFFRVEGAGARAFDNVEQLGQVAQHHHAISVPGAGNFRWGALSGYQQANGFKPFNTTRHTGHVLGTTAGSDTRPINKTIRIWKRSS